MAFQNTQINRLLVFTGREMRGRIPGRSYGETAHKVACLHEDVRKMTPEKHTLYSIGNQFVTKII